MSTNPGVFVLSLDTELAWGTFDQDGLRRFSRHFSQKRPIVRRLLDLFDRYQAPVTWAFVGHLLLRECCGQAGAPPHPQVLRPRYSWYPHDWHHLDPGSDLERDPWWYGADLLEQVLGAAMPHEIGSHTFTHIVVDDPACTREIVRSQLAACVEAHARYGLTIHSLVYPRNKIAFRDVLPEFGITVYRGRERRWYVDLDERLVRALHVIDRTLPLAPTTYPLDSLDEGALVNIPASMFYVARDGFRRAIPLASRVAQAKRGLLRAAERGELFHLWFHPFNLGSDLRLFDGLEQIYRFAAGLRDAGKLEIVPMCAAAELVRRRAAQPPAC